MLAYSTCKLKTGRETAMWSKNTESMTSRTGDGWKSRRKWAKHEVMDPHSEIPVLNSRVDSCGSKRQRLSGSMADYRTVTVMFHMWRQTLSTSRHCHHWSETHQEHVGTHSQPREATVKVMTTKMIVSNLALLLWGDTVFYWQGDFRNKDRVTISKLFHAS